MQIGAAILGIAATSRRFWPDPSRARRHEHRQTLGRRGRRGDLGEAGARERPGDRLPGQQEDQHPRPQGAHYYRAVFAADREIARDAANLETRPTSRYSIALFTYADTNENYTKAFAADLTPARLLDMITAYIHRYTEIPNSTPFPPNHSRPLPKNIATHQQKTNIRCLTTLFYMM